MADERTKIDANQTHTVAGITYDVSEDITNLTVNPVDKRLRVDAAITSDTNNVFDNYGLYAWSDDGTTFYACYQKTDAKWIIIKIVQSTGVTTYATGDTDASTNWTNKASQTYEDFATKF